MQVNLFQKPSFLHQLTHNMTRDCSLNSLFLFWHSKQYLYTTCFQGNSINNLSWYCGLTDSRMRASEKDLPVQANQATAGTTQHSVSAYQIESHVLWNIISNNIESLKGLWLLHHWRTTKNIVQILILKLKSLNGHTVHEVSRPSVRPTRLRRP